MKNFIYLFVLAAFLISCGGESTKSEKTENIVEEKIDCICLWDQVSIKEEPVKKGKYLSSVSLGEKVIFLGETSVDSLDKNREYMKIELSDGTIGWSTKSLFAQNAYTAAVADFAPIFKRPDILTATQDKFEKMDIVAVCKTKDDWMEVYGARKKLKGWIKKETLTTKQEDIAVSVLVEKKLKKNNEIVSSEIEGFLAELPIKNSDFIAYLNELNQKFKAEANEMNQEEEAEQTIE